VCRTSATRRDVARLAQSVEHQTFKAD
jgi:hypothetical protein